MTSLPVKRPQYSRNCATSGCACAHPTQGNPEGVTWRVTFHSVTSVQKAPLGGYCATSGCACTQPTKGVMWPKVTTGDVSLRHIRSKGPTRADIAQLPVALVLVLLYYYSKGKMLETVAHVQNKLPVPSLPVAHTITSSSTTTTNVALSVLIYY